MTIGEHGYPMWKSVPLKSEATQMNTQSPTLSTRETIKMVATMGLLFSVLIYYAYWIAGLPTGRSDFGTVTASGLVGAAITARNRRRLFTAA